MTENAETEVLHASEQGGESGWKSEGLGARLSFSFSIFFSVVPLGKLEKRLPRFDIGALRGGVGGCGGERSTIIFIKIRHRLCRTRDSRYNWINISDPPPR